ncbi:unnamed protein product [Caenorhabditis angaria]|uniref:WH1 domain-containing protein n=1 Tax=Caenorhabditis angaria TaxID=860376 RepID=A0A9P1IHR0_9PELO|nr:unnamed protein product [Caenorhabditis angaria]
MTIIPNLTDFLDEREKKSVANVIFTGDKITASGICQLLRERNGQWELENSPGVVIYSKNSTRKEYKIAFVEPIVNANPVVHLEIIIRNKSFTVQQTHKNLVIFHDDSHRVVGFNFYDTTEAERFCKSLEMLKNKKRDAKKKFSFRGMFSSSKKEKELEIGKPTDFKHLQHVGLDMTADQEELYNRILPGLKMKENDDIALKEFVIRNEDKLRQSIMKDKKKTPKSVKKGGFFKSKSSKIEEGEEKEEEKPPSFKAPIDPLHPNWEEDGLAVPHVDIQKTNNVTNIQISNSTHFEQKSVNQSYNNNNDHMKYEREEQKEEEEEKFLTPIVTKVRQDSYGIRNQPHTLYRFENENKNLQPEAPPALPSRSASRVSPSLSPRLPSHRQSYRWATNPVETAPPPKETKIQATRVAPPPPPLPTSAPKVSLPPVNPPPVAPPPPPPAPPLPSDGFKIRKVEPEPESEEEEEEEMEEAANTRKTSSISNERRSFLDEIQNVDKSKMLRKVSEERHSITTPTGENTMIDAIQQFLDARRVGINPSDSEDSDDDDDWSD